MLLSEGTQVPHPHVWLSKKAAFVCSSYPFTQPFTEPHRVPDVPELRPSIQGTVELWAQGAHCHLGGLRPAKGRPTWGEATLTLIQVCG